LDTLQLAVATRELESKTRTITELEAKNLSLAENNGRLRRKMEDDDRLLQSSQSALQQLQDELQQLLDNVPQLKQTMEDSGRLLLSSKVTIEELQLSLNKQTERVEQLVNQIRSKNEEVAELSNKNHQLELNDQRLRQIIEETKLLVESSNDELENLRMCLAEQQLDKVHELATANCEIESKNKTISELETENLRLAENDSQLRRKMEESDLLLLSSKAEVEELRVSLNNQTERVKHLQDQVKSLDHEKDEAVRKLAELEAKQKEMKPKLTSDVGCGSDEVINNPLRIENPIKIVKDTPIVVTAEPQPVHLSPARTEIESKAAQVSTEKPPAEFEEFSIFSSVQTEVYVDRIVITGIANKDCGRVIGRHGSNAKRIEEQYWVSVSFINGNLFITGGDAESRQAACNDVIDILSVAIECPKINLRRNIFSDGYELRELAFNHDVHIYRPGGENKYVTIWGTLANCRRVHDILQNGNR
jgi:myosin heavy subunit